jgi:hypothetical protein
MRKGNKKGIKETQKERKKERKKINKSIEIGNRIKRNQERWQNTSKPTYFNIQQFSAVSLRRHSVTITNTKQLLPFT